MELHTTAIIKREIEHVFGRRIVSSRDCIQLSEEIYHKTKLLLNQNTLRRIFGLVKADHPPSYSTLMILAKYCGFQSLDEVNAIEISRTVVRDPQDNIMHFLVNLFEDVVPDEYNEPIMVKLFSNTTLLLDYNDDLANKFLRRIAKTECGQKIYFEKLVNIDRLNSYYGNGLRYYSTEKQTAQGQVFANALLIFKHWLNHDNLQLRNHKLILDKLSIDDATPVFIKARYYAAQLYLAQALGYPTEEIVYSAFKYYNKAVKAKADPQTIVFETCMAEALMLTGLFDESLYYIGENKKRVNDKKAVNTPESVQHLLLLEAIALKQLGRTEYAAEQFDTINPGDFCFLTKAFLNILYLNLKISLRKQTNKTTLQLDQLISETGFGQLRHLHVNVHKRPK